MPLPYRPYSNYRRRPRIKQKRMKRRRRRRRPELEPPIPNPMHVDVVTEEILTRLPGKSLMRFKCISKLWSSLISSPYFKHRFLTVPTRQRPQLYMCLQDINDHRSATTLSLAPDTNCNTSSSSFVVDHGLTMGGYIYQNLGGFMCYDYWEKPRIFNPATKQLVTLPSAFKFSNKHNVSYYFGHDPVTDQYKVVCSASVRLTNTQEIRSYHRVLVLKPEGGGSWRKASPLPLDFIPHIGARGAVCIDGVIYYLGWTAADNCMLVSFGVRFHNFKMIQVPRAEELPPAKMKNVCLVECGGKLTVVDQTNLRDKGSLDLWALEDAVSQKWSSKTLVVKPSQLDLIRNSTELVVRGTTRNGKVFLIPTDLVSPFHILCYDLQSNHMVKMDINGVPEHWFSKDKSTVEVMLMDHSETLKYLNT